MLAMLAVSTKTEVFWLCVWMYYHNAIWQCWQQYADHRKNFFVENVEIFIYCHSATDGI